MFASAQGRSRSSGVVRGFVDSAASLASRFRSTSGPATLDSGRQELPGAPHISRLDVPNTRGRSGTAPAARSGSSRFALHQRPQSIVLVDDDADFLDMLSTSLPWEWHVEAFQQPRAFINHLQQEPPRREHDYFLQQEIVNAWRADRAGKPLVPQVLEYWRSQPERFGLASLAICDYMMPGTNGLQALAELSDWPGARVLLTGAEDPALATDAFNRRLIDQFIPKSTLNMQVLMDVVQGLSRRTDERAQQIWSSTLTQQQAELLREPGVAEDLRSFAEKTWLEWICIGEPFGILQLEPTANLDAAAQAAGAAGATRTSQEEIRAGRSITDLAFTRSLGEAAESMAVLPAFYIGREAKLLGAFRAVPQPRGARAMPSYRDWLRKQKVRQGKL